MFESTSHMPRNMVSGKPSTWMARQMNMSPPLDFYFMFTCTDVWECVLQGRQEYGSCSRATDVCPAQLVCVGSCSRLWWPCSITRNMRETVASERSLDVPSVWVRFTLARLKFDSESSVSREDWDCLFLLPHRVRSATIDGIIMVNENPYLAYLV
jgi:hypothetical protein